MNKINITIIYRADHHIMVKSLPINTTFVLFNMSTYAQNRLNLLATVYFYWLLRIHVAVHPLHKVITAWLLANYSLTRHSNKKIPSLSQTREHDHGQKIRTEMQAQCTYVSYWPILLDSCAGIYIGHYIIDLCSAHSLH